MKMIARTAFSLFFAVIAANAIGSKPADAQSADDPTSFDVSGVKLGMTPDEAADAIAAFDPTFKTTKKYLAIPMPQYGFDGESLDHIAPPDNAVAYLTALVALKGEPKFTCPNSNPRECYQSFDEDEDTIRVAFSRVPGQEKVIAVQREKIFHKEPLPAIATLKAGIFGKYPQTEITYQFKYGFSDTTGWLFDARKRILNAAAFKGKNMRPFGGLPGTVKAGDGYGLNAIFVSDNHNNQIAQSFSVTLFDSSALYNSVAQAKAAFDQLRGKANAKQVDDAAKAGTATKF